MAFPKTRLRRLRNSEAMRRLVNGTKLSVDDLVYPLFTCPGTDVKRPIEAMTGCSHLSADLIGTEASEVASLGIPAILLFGLPEKKDPTGAEAWSADSAVTLAIRQIKQVVPHLLVITDVCLCAYTDHGHCGVIKEGKIDNDTTCELLAKMAVAHARAGADIVAPSDMMDGRVGVIREALDSAGFADVAIMAYSAKYASAFYGPFRDAAESAPSFGDRKTYQMDFGDPRQAMQEIVFDIEEGADMVMVKPALPYLDIICRAKERFDVPIAAYNVSGEFMCINAAADAGYLDRDGAMLESLISINRAGADIIITYFAKTAAQMLQK
jgi:porphobilinogen synthase